MGWAAWGAGSALEIRKAFCGAHTLASADPRTPTLQTRVGRDRPGFIACGSSCDIINSTSWMGVYGGGGGGTQLFRRVQ